MTDYALQFKPEDITRRIEAAQGFDSKKKKAGFRNVAGEATIIGSPPMKPATACLKGK